MANIRGMWQNVIIDFFRENSTCNATEQNIVEMVLLRIHAAFFSSDDSADHFFVPQSWSLHLQRFSTLRQIDGESSIGVWGKIVMRQSPLCLEEVLLLQEPKVPRLLVNLSYLCWNLPLFFSHHFYPPKPAPSLEGFSCVFILRISDGLIWNP